MNNSIRSSSVPQAIAFAAACLMLAPGVRAQAPTEAPSNLTPYQTALSEYKNDNYPQARAAIDLAEKAQPGDPAIEILKARILTEQLDFPTAKKTLAALDKAELTPELTASRTMALGDLALRSRDFDNATKYYETLLTANPKDTDLILKIVYSRVGGSDLVTANKYSSQLKPFDPSVNPLDPKHPGTPCYYFAKAALAQATGDTATADEDIQTARTLFGITFSNRYLKTYLELFAPDKTPAARSAPPATSAPPQK